MVKRNSQRSVAFYLLLIAIFFAGDRAAGYMLKKQVAQSQFRYSRLYNGSAKADVLLLGNSRGLTFYQPYIEEITGKSTFNLSYNGLPMDGAEVLALDYLDRYPAPKTLVIDITLCDRLNDALLSGFLTYADQSERWQSILKQTMGRSYWGSKVSDLFCLNNEVFQRAMFYRNKTDKDWLLDRVIPDELADQVDKHSYDLDVRDSLIEMLKITVQSAQAKGVKVQLVIGPYLPGFKVKNLDLLQEKTEKATGLAVHNYRLALSDRSYFGDFMHPNKKGSMAYMDLLRRDGIFD